MAEVTASLVKALREKTDAPMLECKKALVEAVGDFDKAEEILRVRLGNKVSKAASRVTREGSVRAAVSADMRSAVLLEVNCETDFVTRNEYFQTFVSAIASLILKEQPVDLSALSALNYEEGVTVEQARQDLVGRIGENITVRRFVCLHTEHRFASYVHGDRIGVVVDHSGDEMVGKDLALHIVASRPLCVSRDQVDPAILEKERSVFEQQAQTTGKPAAVIQKMVEGRLTKFFGETVLVDQSFVKDPSQTVAQMLSAHKASVYDFSLFVVGEGIEKVETDFSKEVASVVLEHR